MNNKVTPIDMNMLDTIKSLIEDNQLSFLIGAGFSKNINKKAFPSWEELLSDAIWKKYGSGVDAERADLEKSVSEKILKEKSLLDIASGVVSDAGYHEAIDEYIEAHTPYLSLSEGKTVLMKDGSVLPVSVNESCHRLLRQLDVHNIYTFNYDNALEFFLGNKDELSKKKAALLSEKAKSQHELKKTEARLTVIREILSSDPSEREMTHKAPSLSDDPLQNINGLQKEESELFGQRQKQLSSIWSKEHELDAVEKEIENAYLVVNKSSEIALTSSGHNIFKIHGNLRMPGDTQYGFDGDRHAQYIITREDYDTYETKHQAFVNLMRIDLLRNRFCIIGVSGTDANFLAWVNWVKDVLDKVEEDDLAGKRQSFFIYAGKEDLGRDMQQMLKNHFIQAVVLKDLFPEASDENQRVKAFLKYIQPNNTSQTDKLAKLWRNIDRGTWRNKNSGSLPEGEDLEELCRLSSSIVFHKSTSTVHSSAKNIQQSIDESATKEGMDLQHAKIISAAIRCSLFPLDNSSSNSLKILSNTKDDFVRETYSYAQKRHLLLTYPARLDDKALGNDDYSKLMKRLFLYDFPSKEECDIFCNSGLDYIRAHSIQMLLFGASDIELEKSAKKFASPQELVMADDWLSWLEQSPKTPLHSTAEKYRAKFPIFRLSDYFKSYLAEMKKRNEVSTYGNIAETIYVDGWYAGYENASVILNSILELGITFAGHTVLSDDDWIAVSGELKSYYPYPLAFYTIARNSKENVCKRVAQELIYDEMAYNYLPDLLKRMIDSITSERTPKDMIPAISRFTKELFVAVPVSKWGKSFIHAIDEFLTHSVKNSSYYVLKDFYRFAAEGIAYIRNKDIKIQVLKHILDNLEDKKSHLDSEINLLAIAARRGLTAKDFEPLSEKLVNYVSGKEKFDTYVVINLAHLLSKDDRRKIYDALEKQSMKDSNLVDAYSFLIKGERARSISYKQKIVSRKDIWQTGIGEKQISFGGGFAKISSVDHILHFNHRQCLAIYNDLKSVLDIVRKHLDNPKHENIDKGWMSLENYFREIAIDMLVFVHRHEECLSSRPDFNDTISELKYVYENCLYGKTVLQMISDDKILRAIRSMMLEAKTNGIQKLGPEYKALLSAILARKSKDVNICFQHISWAIKEYEEFFNTDEFNSLLTSVLGSYAQYFVLGNSRPWDVLGCEKEEAEKHLCRIASILSSRNWPHPFWSTYKKRYYLQ